MNITVSVGRKIYVRGSGGYYDATQDSHASQTIALPDEATPEQVKLARLVLSEELDEAVDMHLFINGLITRENLVARNAKRKELYAVLRKPLESLSADPTRN